MIDAPAGAVSAVLLAPLCVKHARRRSGIGTALLEWAAAAAKAAGERWMVVLCDHVCCSRFGFIDFSACGPGVLGDAKDELPSYSQLLPLGKGDANELSGGVSSASSKRNVEKGLFDFGRPEAAAKVSVAARRAADPKRKPRVSIKRAGS